MKLDKTTESILIFLISFVFIISAYYVSRVAVVDYVSSEYHLEMDLTGARLSDMVYATVKRSSQWTTKYGHGAQFDFVLHNHSNSEINNWNISMEVPEGSDISQHNGIGVNVEKGKVILEPDSDHLTLKRNTPIEFSIVINTQEPFYPEKLGFTGYQRGVFAESIANNVIFLAFMIWAFLFVGFFVTRFNLKNYREKQKNDVRIILQSMNTFISFIDAKDPYTRGHSRRVAMYAAEIAKRMRLSEDEVQNIYYAGLLHDAGKISIPDAVLNKPGKLTDEERKQIQEHTVAGGKMLKQLSSLRGIRETALYHHERYDGKGYPEGLKGESIPLYARIVGVADSYDAMSSNRVYRRHLSKDEIIEEIQKGSSTQFDPNVVPYMVDMINDGYVNVVKMETADSDDKSSDFHLTEDDIPSVYMGF
ncbi:HD-GYP domain-containing protein [Butyrivibrio sp. FCS014]|uniref:HD-GYP domain-containing protein n=1 Tax=Butyrivibrio sp. FCS014 TaxID=1408304 RepID=UPI0004678D46|nr:HD-GYP domain-containing protein [Butyrivibrio sp. FCS014]